MDDWRLTSNSDNITFSDNYHLSAIKQPSTEICMVVEEEPVYNGKMYKEFEITRCSPICDMYIGCTVPYIEHTINPSNYNILKQNSWLLSTAKGILWGKNTGIPSYELGKCVQGDRIGCLLDLDSGSLDFYRNGKKFTSGYSSGISESVVITVILATAGDIITALPGAELPI